MRIQTSRPPDEPTEADAPSSPGQSAGNAYAFVGDRLRALRKGRGLTQADVARVIAVSPQQYQKYEDAQSKCSLTTMIALAEFYAVPLSSMLPAIAPETAEPGPVRKNPADMPTEADLLARLVGSFVQLRDIGEKTRLVELVEAMQTAHSRSS